jgi:cytochrome c biogenesis protein CcmG/thiol:disulfide interchange protein DsbE
MTKRRIAALAAVVIVPLAVLVIVLVSLLSGDDGQSRDSARAPAAKPPGKSDRTSTPGGSTRETGTDASGDPLPVLAVGAAPKQVAGKLVPAASDGTLELGELRGSPVVVNLWSSSCIPCRSEARLLESESVRLGRRGVVFVGINVADSRAAAERFRTEFGITYAALQDKGTRTVRKLGAKGVPETFFISKRGKVVAHVVGSLTIGELEVGVRAAQTGRARPTDLGGGQVPLR